MSNVPRDLPADLDKDVRATAAAAADLGAGYHDELATSLVDKVEAEIARRRGETVAPPRLVPEVDGSSSLGDRGAIAVAIVSVVMLIPLTAVAGAFAHLAGMVLAWVAVLGINAAYTLGRRR